METTPSPLLADCPVVITLPVQWGDQDAFGHVNNVMYFRWFESSRIAYGSRIGLSDLMATQKIGPILAAISCNYRRQLNYPDTVQVGAKITRIGRSSMTMEHKLASHAQQTIIADSTSTIVTFNYAANQPVAVPEAVRAAIEKLEGKPL